MGNELLMSGSIFGVAVSMELGVEPEDRITKYLYLLYII